MSARGPRDCGLVASMTTPSFDVGLYRLARGFASKRHRHEAPGMVVGVTGSFELSGGLERDRVAIGPEDGVLLSDGDPHRERAGEVCLCILARARRADATGARLSSPKNIRRVFPSRGLLGARVLSELFRVDDLSPLVVEALLHDALAALGRGERFAPRVARAAERLEERYLSPPSVPELAREWGVSPDHFSRTFRRALGCTVPEYARRVRVRRAARLLDASTSPLADVAAACGFADQSHLTRQFRRESGFTPAAYRLLARSGSIPRGLPT